MTTRRGRCSTRTQYGRNVEHAECRPRDTSHPFFFFWSMATRKRGVARPVNHPVQHWSQWFHSSTRSSSRILNSTVVERRLFVNEERRRSSGPGQGLSMTRCRGQIRDTCNSWMVLNDSSDTSYVTYSAERFLSTFCNTFASDRAVYTVNMSRWGSSLRMNLALVRGVSCVNLNTPYTVDSRLALGCVPTNCLGTTGWKWSFVI